MVTEDQLIKKTREAGKKYLKEHPEAFGGGIESSTGIRRSSSGQRISVTTPTEEAAGVTPITKKQAEQTESGGIKRFSATTGKITPAETVAIDGLEYSVRPEEREKFVQNLLKPQAKKQRKGDWLSPELIKYGYDWAATQTMRGGDWLSKMTEMGIKKAGFKPSPLFFDPKKSPIKGETAKELISSAYMFSSLGGVFKTGTAQQQESQYVWDVAKQRFVRKSDIETYLAATREGKTIKLLGRSGSNYQAKAEKARTLLRLAKDDTARKKLLKIIEKSYGKNFVKEFATQEGLHYMKTAPIITTTPKTTQAIIQPTSTMFQPTLPRMEYADVVGAAVKSTQELFQPSQTGRTAWATDSNFFSKTKSGQDTIQKSKPAQDIFQRTTPTQKPVQRTSQQPAQKQRPAQKTKQLPKFAQPTIQTPRLKTQPRTGRGIGFPKIKTKPVRKIIFPIGLPSLALPKVAKKQQAWKAQAKGKGGGWKTISKKPLSRQAALGRMAYAMDNSTSARGRIIKIKGEPSPQRNDYFGRTQHKYRPYKIIKGRPVKMHNQFIEKRSARIDTKGEKMGLSLAKLSSQMKWGITKRKKK